LSNGLIADDGERQFDATFKSGWSKGMNSPRQIPEREQRQPAQQAQTRLVETTTQPATYAEEPAWLNEPDAMDGPPEKQIPQSPADWELFTLCDAFKPRAPVKYLVDDLIAEATLNIPFGIPGCFKTFLLGDMALCVAAGIDWLGPLPSGGAPARSVNQAPVLWIDADNGARRMHERFEALGRARNIDPEAVPLYYVSLPTPPFRADCAVSVGGLIELCQTKEIGLVVLDNLGTISGGAVENDPSMASVMANLRRVAETTGAAVNVIHHQRKTSGQNVRAGETLRGHTSIEAALDLALLITREEDDAAVTIRSTKSRGADVEPFGALFTYEHAPNTSELSAARFYSREVLDNRKPARARRAIVEALRMTGGAMNKTELVNGAKSIEDGVGVNYYRQTIELLVKSGTLVETPGYKNSLVYTMKDK
jgi:hypothetical protein